MKSQSKESQDLFAYYLIGEKGTFLDLGCHHPTDNNNSIALEKLGWNGLCVDRKTDYSYKGRRTPFLCININDDDFIEKVDSYFPSSKHIDYISMDVDGNSYTCLEKLLTSGYSFGCMTFEHDDYRQNGRLKIPAKKLLEEYNYEVLFEDVTTPTTFHNSFVPWEDWWIDSSRFDDTILSLKSKDLSYEECIKLMEKVI